jgi:hypothetical protein
MENAIGEDFERCRRCARVLTSRSVFLFHGPDGPRARCRACALTDGPMLRRSLGIAAVVGTVLLAINQGDVLLSGRWPVALAWKIPLTYLVPFLVATWGALLAARVRADS